MELPNSCQELFLNDITDVYVYLAEDCKFSLPFNVPFQASLSNVVLPSENKCLLHITANEALYNKLVVESASPICCTQGSISVKQTHALSGRITIFTYDVETTVEQGISSLKACIRSMNAADNIVIIKIIDGNMYLLYTLPNTFRIMVSDTDMKSANAKINTKAMSDYIPLTLKS